jgi:stearoyl-CoA desaturase (delta-9 desaturase)
MKPGVMIERYAKDLMRDPFHAMIDRRKNWIKLTFLSWVAFFLLGFGVGILAGTTTTGPIQFGASLFIWVGALRTVLVWHTTWSVNSLSHIATD